MNQVPRALTFAAYDALAATTDKHGEWNNPLPPLAYYALGIGGEAGEIVDKIKKLYRDHQGLLVNEGHKVAIALELGDALWYLSRTASQLGLSLEEIAVMNIQKLAERKAANNIHGEGDAR